MGFTPRDWRDAPGDLSTPITAVALEDLETRVTAGIPYENVKWHGAVGNNTGDQTAAIQAAIDACEANGGTVYIPAGTYRMLGSLELHAAITLLGDGATASVLSWPTSLGAGTWALTPDLTAGDAQQSRISGLKFNGPGTYGPFGTAVSNMNGVKIASQQLVEHCEIHFFHRGLGILEDHSEVTNCVITSNTYNIAWLAGSAGGGDHHFISNSLTGATIASLYVENEQGIGGSFFLGTHLGLAPYGILSAPGKAGNPFIGLTTFIDSPTEWFGTAAIWGSNATDQIFTSRWIGCGTSYDPTNLLPATTYEFLVRAGQIKDCVFDMVNFRSQNGEPGTAYFSTTGSGQAHLNDRYEMVPNDVLRSNTAAFLHRASGGEPTLCSFVDEGGVSGRFCRAEEAVTKGHLLKMKDGGINGCRTYDDDTLADAPLGVALQSGAAGEIIAVATQGYVVELVADGTITDGGGRPLKPAATNGRVVQASGWSDGPIVGVSLVGTTVGNAFEVHLRLGAWG